MSFVCVWKSFNDSSCTGGAISSKKGVVIFEEGEFCWTGKEENELLFKEPVIFGIGNGLFDVIIGTGSKDLTYGAADFGLSRIICWKAEYDVDESSKTEFVGESGESCKSEFAVCVVPTGGPCFSMHRTVNWRPRFVWFAIEGNDAVRHAFERDFTDSNPSCWKPLFILDLHLRTKNFKHWELTHKYEPVRIRPVARALNSRSPGLESTNRIIESISCLNVFP